MNLLEVVLVTVILFAALSIVWFTLKTGISPMPSTRLVISQVCTIIRDIPAKSIYELGSGWGGLASAIARTNNGSAVIGYELSILPWLFSTMRHRITRYPNLSFVRQNFLEADLTSADLLICYLYPDGMLRLSQQLANQQPKALKIISNTFRLPGYNPTKTIYMQDIYRTPLYLYELSSADFTGSNLDNGRCK